MKTCHHASDSEQHRREIDLQCVEVADVGHVKHREHADERVHENHHGVAALSIVINHTAEGEEELTEDDTDRGNSFLDVAMVIEKVELPSAADQPLT